MLESEVVFYIVKLVFGGITAFLAILLLSRTRDSVWIFMVCGAIFSYTGLVFELLLKVGIISEFSLKIFNLPFVPLFFYGSSSNFLYNFFYLKNNPCEKIGK